MSEQRAQIAHGNWPQLLLTVDVRHEISHSHRQLENGHYDWHTDRGSSRIEDGINTENNHS